MHSATAQTDTKTREISDIPHCPGGQVLDHLVADNLARALGEPVYLEAAELFARDASSKVAEICSYYASQDYLPLAASAHSLKSSSAMLGCEKLALTLAAVEAAARSANPESMAAMATNLPLLLQQTLSRLQERAESKKAQATAHTKPF